MQHIYRRCKHCNKEYLYCTYENGIPSAKFTTLYSNGCEKIVGDLYVK